MPFTRLLLWLSNTDEGRGSLECCSPWGHRAGHDLEAEQQQQPLLRLWNHPCPTRLTSSWESESMSTAWQNWSNVSSYSMTFLPCVDGGKVTFSCTGTRHSFRVGIWVQLVRTCDLCLYRQLQTPPLSKENSLHLTPQLPDITHTSSFNSGCPCGVFLFWLPLMMIGTLFLRGNHVSDERKRTQGDFFP